MSRNNLSDAYRSTMGALGSLSTSISEADSLLRHLQDEIECAEEGEGTARIAGTGRLQDDVAVVRSAVAHQAIILKNLLSARLPGLLSDLEELAGKKYLAEAAKPRAAVSDAPDKLAEFIRSRSD